MAILKRTMALLFVTVMIVTSAGCKKNTEQDYSSFMEASEIMDVVSKITQSEGNSTSVVSNTSKADSSSQLQRPSSSSSAAKSSASNTTGYTSQASSSNVSSKSKTSLPKKDYSKSLKILAIGNSFSVDSMEYLYDICKSAGIQEVILGNLHVSGCELKTHYKYIVESSSKYTYSKNTDGVWNSTVNQTIYSGLTDESWDIIVLQQYSGNSGLAYTYGELNAILRFSDQNKPNAETRMMWNLTWAYQSTSKHNDFAKYDNNQMTMYNKIVNTVNSKVLTEDLIAGVIPTGTAIQNLRTSYIGDTLTRDGQHLSYDYGRYTAALTWFHYITDISPDKVDWTPQAYPAIKNDLDVIRESVVNAVKSPYTVTQSKYTQKP